MQDMEIPEFLESYEEDDIHEELLDLIPDEFDKSEGQHFFNFTRPTAYIVAQQRGFYIPEAIKLIWPQFSHGEFLDEHAKQVGIYRKEAQYATGEITITGAAGVKIPAGYTVSTEAKNDVASQDFETMEECIIGSNGTVTVKAKALVAGADGNVAAETIVVNTTSYDDVTTVINNAKFEGGTEEEDDDSLYARLHEFNQQQGDRNTGNPSDYKRWAEEVSGTGTAKVERPKDTSGLVTIILTDGNGDPASKELCSEVYNHIMSPDDEDSRLAPCGAFLSVIPPTTLNIVVTATVELTSGTAEDIAATFATNLKAYFKDAINHKEVLYHKVCNILGDIEGVYDFKDLTINDGAVNIPLESGTFPYTDSSLITLTAVEDV